MDLHFPLTSQWHTLRRTIIASLGWTRKNSGSSTMKRTLGAIVLLLSYVTWLQAETPKEGKAFVPEPVLPGGLVLPLYPPDSPRLKRERIHEPERYNTSLKGKSD